MNQSTTTTVHKRPRSKSKSPNETRKKRPRSRSSSRSSSRLSSPNVALAYAKILDDDSGSSVLSEAEFKSIFRIKKVRGDGNCFFYALSQGLYGGVHEHGRIRDELCEAYEKERKNKEFQNMEFVWSSDHKLRCLSEPQRERDICRDKEYADMECDAFMCSLVFKVDIIIIFKNVDNTYLVDRYICPTEIKKKRTAHENKLLPDRVYLFHNGNESMYGGHTDALELM